MATVRERSAPGMHIVIDARLAGTRQRGIGRYSEEMLRALDAREDLPRVTAFVSHEAALRLGSVFFRVTLRAVGALWYSVWQEQIRFAFVLLSSRPSLVHFFHFNVPLLAAAVFTLLRIPWVVTVHDLILLHAGPVAEATTRWYPLYWLKFQGYRITVWFIAKFASRIIAVSEETARVLTEALCIPTARIVVIGEGTEHLDRVARHGSDRRKQRSILPYVLYVGSAYPHKNLPVLLEAFGQFVQKPARQGYALLLIGAPDAFRRWLAAKVGEFPSVRVHFVDHVSDEALRDFYVHARALVLPSREEGFGLPLLEALSVGTPSIVSDIPSLREIAGEAAVYVRPGDVLSLLTALETALSGSAQARLRLRETKQIGMARVGRYTWEGAASRLTALYHEYVRVQGPKAAWEGAPLRMLKFGIAMLSLASLLFLSPLTALLALFALVAVELYWIELTSTNALALYLMSVFLLSFLSAAMTIFLGVSSIVVFSLSLPLALLFSDLSFASFLGVSSLLVGFLSWQMLLAASWLPIPILARAAVTTVAVSLLLGIFGLSPLSSRKVFFALATILTLLLLTSPWVM